MAYKPGFVHETFVPLDDYSSGTAVTSCLKRSTRMTCTNTVEGLPPHSSLFDLAPGGVYPATSVTGGAVRSYRPISPLPSGFPKGGIISVALSLKPAFVNWPRRTLSATLFCVEPGLSSNLAVTRKISSHPAIWCSTR